jgi:hypothetical protein
VKVVRRGGGEEEEERRRTLFSNVMLATGSGDHTTFLIKAASTAARIG